MTPGRPLMVAKRVREFLAPPRTWAFSRDVHQELRRAIGGFAM
jgi:hypothetical protein